MKRSPFHSFLSVLYCSCLLSLTAGFSPVQAQTVSSSSQNVDKASLPGLSLEVPIEGKFVEKEWETLVKSYGKVATGRNGIYKIPSANIPVLSSEPLNVASKVAAEKNKATIFMAVDQGNGNYVAPGNGMYSEVEALLKNFAERTRINYNIKLANDSYVEAQKKQDRLTKQSEKLVRDIERNKKEKENLTKRLEENARELEQLQRDTETNKTDLSSSGKDLETKKQALEEAKSKFPK
ncbi:hypothetical protein ACFQ4C_18260 [Larkinella insperata]|uniref:Uncharacterized protein n=1 Tax=Larkinella insperata TaxID=332158 RepID=A0ABW3QF69_9BACT|nr:hypothetical protein [Larkinella insperata]